MEAQQKKKILITGASRGLGCSLVKILAANSNYQLVLVARDSGDLQKLKSEIEKINQHVEIFAIDLSQKENLNSLLEKVKDVDILVNNAAGKYFGQFTSQSQDEIMKIVQLNCMTPMFLCHHYAKIMKEKNSGLIINIASLSAFFPVPYMSVYSATKAFLVSLGECLDQEFAGTGVRVMTVCPGIINTDFHKTAGLSGLSKKKNSLAVMSPDEVAKSIADHIDKPSPIIIPGVYNKALNFLSRFTTRAFKVKSVARIYKKILDDN